MSDAEMFVTVPGTGTGSLARNEPLTKQEAAEMRMLGAGVVSARLFCTLHPQEGQKQPDSAILQKAMDMAHRELSKWVLSWAREEGQLFIPTAAHQDLNGFFYSLLHGQVGAINHLHRVEDEAEKICGCKVTFWPAITVAGHYEIQDGRTTRIK